MSTIIVKIITVILGLSKLSVVKLINLVESIEVKMTGNVYFPTPEPDMITIVKAKEALVNASALAAKGGLADTALVKVRRRELSLLLNTLRAYVETISNMDPLTAETVALTSGMGVKKMSLPPKNVFKVKNTKASGIVKITCPRVKDDVTFDFESTATPKDETTYVAVGPSTKCTRTIAGLTFATNYSFRYMVLNRKTGESAWSNPITLVVT